MYIGSLGLILEYDGSTWRKIDVDSNWASGLAYEARTDTVFVGAQNNLGYLKTQPGGVRTFVSLLGQLPADSRDIGAVFGVYATPDGVFFVGSRSVMRWREGRFRTWKMPAASKLESGWVAGVLYVSSPEVGLLRLEGDAFVPASDDPLFQRTEVTGIVAEQDGALLIGTRNDGLFTLREHAVRPLECECADFLNHAGIYNLLRLRDGSLAIATHDVGLVMLDPAHHFHWRLNEQSCVHGKDIFSLFEDTEGGLWMGLQSGVARAELNSPLSILRARPDDDMSSAYCLSSWLGVAVLGCHSGMFQVTAADPASAVGPHLEWLPGTTLSGTANCSVENGLLSITRGKVLLLDADGRLVPVAEEVSGAQDIISSQTHPGRVYVVDERGCIRTLRLDAATRRWVCEGTRVDLGTKGGMFSLTESMRGDLWVGTSEHGVMRVEFATDGTARVSSFLDAPGPLQGCRDAMVCFGGGPPRFRTTHKVCGVDDSGQAVRTITEFGERFCDGSYNLGEITSYDPDSLWLTASDVNDPTGESLRGRASKGVNGQAPTFKPLPHKIEEAIGNPTVLHPVDKLPSPLKTLLIVGKFGNAVVRMDVPRWDAQPVPRPFATLVRRAFTVDGAEAPPILGEPLPYARNSVHFEFAAGTLAFGAAPRFQTRLVNFGTGGWSDFSDRASMDYLNLPEGRYTFEVRARNADGQLGSVASLPFRILPPWQRSPLACALYALAAALGLFALVRWRGRQLEKRNAALADLVDARTGELRAREADLLANQRDLMRARDNAERANRAKSAFLASMSHELRTPLNAILGYAQVLLKQSGLPGRSREQIHVIGQSGRHLLGMINEVLDLSKVEAGKLALSQQNFSLSQMLDEVYAVFRPRFAEEGLTFVQNREEGLPAAVRSDPGRLRQVLFNLLSNASKFTRQGGVLLEVSLAESGQVRFAVSDTGIGIEARDLDNIFLAFYQAGEHDLAVQGTGLGLAISQRLVELLGGQLKVESTPGRGSRFWFDLPLTAVESPVDLPWRPPDDRLPGHITGYEGAPRRLLLVDDLSENRRVLRDFLQPLGFVIEEAVDGADCLASCARRLPDAVLLDLRLGTPDGFEVARILRGQHARTPLGIVAISASVFESDRQRAIDAGCDDFLPKPFEETQLLGTLGHVLKLRWVYAASVESAAPAPGPLPNDGVDARLREETEILLELSLRGDVVGIRKHLETLRSAGVNDGTAGLVRRLEPLVATYQMDGIHTLLLEVQAHARV